MYFYFLSLVTKKHTISPPIDTYLCLFFSSLTLSKIVFQSKTFLSFAPGNSVVSHSWLLPKKVSIGLTLYIIIFFSETTFNFCTPTHPLFCKVTP